MKQTERRIQGILLSLLVGIIFIYPGVGEGLAEDVSPGSARPSVVVRETTPGGEGSVQEDHQVLATVDGVPLLSWQAKAMVSYGAARDVTSAVDMWIDIRLKLAAARERKLEESREARFILDLYRDYFLSGRLLTTALEKEVPPVDEAGARQRYEEQKKRYERPFTASVRHITVQRRDLARAIVEKARQDPNLIETLYERYHTRKEANKGMLNNVSRERLVRELGEETVTAVEASKAGAILGPLVGARGFEVVQVLAVNPAHKVEFEKVKKGIISQMQRAALTEHQQKILDEIRARATIVRLDKPATGEKPSTGPAGESKKPGAGSSGKTP